MGVSSFHGTRKQFNPDGTFGVADPRQDDKKESSCELLEDEKAAGDEDDHPESDEEPGETTSTEGHREGHSEEVLK